MRRKARSAPPRRRLQELRLDNQLSSDLSKGPWFYVGLLPDVPGTGSKWVYSKFGWNPKQPFINGCLVKQPFPNIKIWNHPIETIIYKWLFGVPGVNYNQCCNLLINGVWIQG